MPEVVWRRTAEGVVLHRVSGGDYVVLDAPGAELWEALERSSTLGQVAAALAERFDADASALVPDVERALVDLLERGLVTRLPA